MYILPTGLLLLDDERDHRSRDDPEPGRSHGVRHRRQRPHARRLQALLHGTDSLVKLN